MDARWNAAIGRYTRPDGTYDERPTEFREASVSLFSYDDWSLRILVERESSRRVRVRAIIEPHALARSASASVRLRMDGETQTFATLPASDTSFVIDRCVDVAPETTLQLDVDTGVEVRSVRHCP
ncbi:MAG: hypothetical protein JNM94_06940 [Phycisphaerae bacterium]|nr:hypothetical protein [Phycisphaerae bacterium]